MWGGTAVVWGLRVCGHPSTPLTTTHPPWPGLELCMRMRVTLVVQLSPSRVVFAAGCWCCCCEEWYVQHTYPIFTAGARTALRRTRPCSARARRPTSCAWVGPCQGVSALNVAGVEYWVVEQGSGDPPDPLCALRSHSDHTQTHTHTQTAVHCPFQHRLREQLGFDNTSAGACRVLSGAAALSVTPGRLTGSTTDSCLSPSPPPFVSPPTHHT